MTLVVNAALDKHVTWFGENEREKELLRCFRNVEKLAQEQQEILGFVDQFQDLLACIEAQQSCGKLYITSSNESTQEVNLDDVQFAWDGPKNQLWSHWWLIVWLMKCWETRCGRHACLFSRTMSSR